MKLVIEKGAYYTPDGTCAFQGQLFDEDGDLVQTAVGDTVDDVVHIIDFRNA